jgi:cytochrome d ubiquinol oxidase subunit II
MSYVFLQHYWWFLISLLGALLVFLMFVQGGNSMLFEIGKDETEVSMLVNSTGRKWELAFTTLVTFGGAFFASFPLFYSTSFGGAYWLWMIILFTFIFQAVSYEFQSSPGNLTGRRVYRIFLIINGIVAPLLIGVAVATFFTGSGFYVNKAHIFSGDMPVISSWASRWHGLEALANIWNLVFGLAVLFLVRVLGILYFINNVKSNEIYKRSRRKLVPNFISFLVFFIAFLVHILSGYGFAVETAGGTVFMEKFKYLHNFMNMPPVSAIFVVGVLAVLYGVVRTLYVSAYVKGIWFAGAGTILAVTALLLCAGFANTSYYPSTVDLQSSLTIFNSSSSFLTLKVMFYVSLLIPIVAGYIYRTWRAMDKNGISPEEQKENGGY